MSSVQDGRRLEPARIVGWIAGGVMLTLTLLIVAAPLDVLLCRYVPDDAFYYLQPARNFARAGFSSFDGIHFTNGYQPLWFLLCTPIFLLFPDGGEAPLRLLLLCQCVVAGLTAYLLASFAARRLGVLPAALGMLLFIAIMYRTFINGLESAVTMLLYVVLLRFFDRLAMRPPKVSLTSGRFASLGALAALVFLARTDNVFLVAALSVWALFRVGWRLPGSLARLAAFAAPVAVLAGGYLASNLALTGHLTPVSGAAKVYYSQQNRAADAARLGGMTAAYTENVIWPFRERGWRFVAVAIVGGALALVALPLRTRLGPEFAALVRLWPFFVGAIGSWLYYGLVFHAPFSQTLWYYGPHALLAALVLAAIGAWAEPRVQRLTGAVGLVSSALVVFVLGWFPDAVVLRATASLAVLALVVSFVARRFLNARGMTTLPAVILGPGLLLAAVATFMVARNGGYHGFVTAAVVAATLASILLVGRFAGRPSPAAMVGVAVVLLGFVVQEGRLIVGITTAPPSDWNYHLYRGALWARENLPRDATIWSGSTGILGYFSDRVCVNTDGLANDFDFLENYLKAGRVGEYLREWDFGVDAFGDDALAKYHPAGRFVELPRAFDLPAFKDGAASRKLRVFQMDARQGWPLATAFEIVDAQAARHDHVQVRWRARWLPSGGATISLCYDLDQTWDNGNETWITIDGIAARGGEGVYDWRPRGVPPGRYYLGGYLHDGKEGFVLARLNRPVVVGGADPQKEPG